MRKMDDDDIQEYESSGWRKRQVAMHEVQRIGQELEESYRNEVLEEVAKEIEKMTAFGKDTIGSFTVFIRGMKR